MSQPPDTIRSRPVGGTEHSWCRAVPGGTGVTVLSLLLSKPPNLPLLLSSLHSLQLAHPLLRSKLHFDPTNSTFSFVIPRAPNLDIKHFPLTSPHPGFRPESVPDDSTRPGSLSPVPGARAEEVDPNRPGTHSVRPTSSVSPFHAIIEHEMNQNPWAKQLSDPDTDIDVLFASVYELVGDHWAVVLRVHTAACDRAAAVGMLTELVELIRGGGSGGGVKEEAEGSLGIEDYVPSGKANKPFWARGMDMLGYGLNSFRFTNLEFVDTREMNRSSEFIRWKIGSDVTKRILDGCRSRGIKICGLLAAAGLIAVRSSKSLPDEQWEKYAVATLVDCRTMLEPVLTCHNVGFYHSVIINSHDINGEEKLWELAIRTYTSFANAKKDNKHFTDMSDLNFLMCRAIENPGLTPSASLRTSFISVFEDLVVDESNEFHRELGLEDCVGCASVHGVGPSIAVFDAIRDGELDCALVYPSPLHSRKQIQDLVNHMEKILVDGCK